MFHKQRLSIKNPKRCCLCKNSMECSLQLHLVTECTSTDILIRNYISEIKKFSAITRFKFLKIQPQFRLEWILKAGQFKEGNKQFKTTYPFINKTNVTEGVDKKNNQSMKIAIQEYQQILQTIGKRSIIAFTDGSKIENQCGSGSVLYYQTGKTERIQTSLRNCSNNFAELYAIKNTLERIHERFLEGEPVVKDIHIFSDSKYTIGLLCSKHTDNKYFYLTNLILDIASDKNFPTVSLHWIPSHISYMSNNKKIEIQGNVIADRLAANAASDRYSRCLNVEDIFFRIPRQVLQSSANLVHAIDCKILDELKTKPIGPSSDDFSLANATQDASHPATS